MQNETNYLSLSWSISRGRDTYGYNICRLDDHKTGKRYRCSGGGYDMQGSVLGEWLQNNYQDRLISLKDNGPEGKPVTVDCGYATPGYLKREDLYGLTFNPNGKATVDGACGVESVIKIAEACGISITSDWNRRANRKNGFFVS
jgi:hypothetical protein